MDAIASEYDWQQVDGPLDALVWGYLLRFGTEAMWQLAEEREIDVLDVLAELERGLDEGTAIDPDTESE